MYTRFDDLIEPVRQLSAVFSRYRGNDFDNVLRDFVEYLHNNLGDNFLHKLRDHIDEIL
jgi:hypothetical protein